MYIYFSQMLTNILLSSSFPKNPNLFIKEVTIDPAILLEWRGCRFKLLEIHVDVVPAIRLPYWPEKTYRNRRLFTTDILTIPCLAVPKMASVHEYLWRCSMSLQETAIFRKLKPCIRNSYVAAKALVNSKAVCPSVACRDDESIELFRNTYSLSPDDDVYVTKSAEDVVPTYVLKMMFLFALEDKVASEGLQSVFESVGKERKPALSKTANYGPAEQRNIYRRFPEFDVDLVKDIFRRCESCLLDGSVPSFFNPKQNVIDKKEDGEVKLILSFVQYINKLLA